MMMKKISPMFLLLALALAFPLQAMADELVSLKVGVINLSPEGSFASGNTTLANPIQDEVDLEDDLDFGDKSKVMAEAALQLGSFRLSAGYLPLKFDGTAVLGRNIRFENLNFPQGATVDGELDVDLYDLALAWHIVNIDDAPVRFQFGPELSVKIVDGEVSMENQATGLREEVSGTAPVPTIGARARVGLGDFVAVIGRVGYLEVSGNSFLDADAQVEFSPLPFVGVFGGYRHLDLDIDEDDILIDATFAGPYAGAFVRF
jgi:outer membrane protein